MTSSEARAIKDAAESIAGCKSELLRETYERVVAASLDRRNFIDFDPAMAKPLLTLLFDHLAREGYSICLMARPPEMEQVWRVSW